MSKDEDFSQYVHARWATLVRAGVFLGCDLDEAEDLAQSTLLRCYKKWERVSRAEDRDAYVYRMLLNSLRDSKRRLWHREQPTAVIESTGPTPPSPDPDIAATVHDALAALSKVNREVVVLRYLLDLSEHQTAEILGVATGTVKSRLSRGLAHLATDAEIQNLSPGGIP